MKQFSEICCAFPEVTIAPHFEKEAFKAGKKIFATLDKKNNTATLKLSPADQDIFSLFDKNAIYPVQNKWGKQGWTIINLALIRDDMLMDAIKAAYHEVVSKNRAKK